MERIIYLLLIGIIILQSCTSNDINQKNDQIELIGKIGEFNASIVLNKDGDKYWGDFIYTDIDKPEIKVEGVTEGKKMILREFDIDNVLKGIFEGDYFDGRYIGNWRNPNRNKKVAFSFAIYEDNTEQKESAKMDSKANVITTLKPQELIKIHFKPYKIEGQKKAFYKKEDRNIEVNFEKIEQYEKDGSKYALVFFSNFDYDPKYGREEYHAASGFISIAKYEEKKGYWDLVKINYECDCGYGDWGNVNIPSLEKHGKEYFLISGGSSMHQGFFQSYFSICNTENFKASAKLVTSVTNSGALPEKGEEIEYESEITFEDTNNQLLMTVEYKGIDYDYSTKTKIDMNKTDVYQYDKKSMKFSK